MRGIPSRVTKEGLNPKKSWIETRGTSKDAVTEGDPKITNLIEARMYDTRLVHCMSMVLEQLKWVVKEKQCFDFETGKVKNWYSYA